MPQHEPTQAQKEMMRMPEESVEQDKHEHPHKNGTNGKAHPASAEDAEVERLAKLSILQYEQERKDAAERLNVRASVLDKLVEAERAKSGAGEDKLQGHAISFPEPEPWLEPVAGAKLLDEIAKAIRRHVVLPDHACDTCALWVLHTYLLDCFLVSPRLCIRSPMKGWGKTTLEDVLGRMVLRPLPTANVTPAAIFRVVEACRPTLLIDEADTFVSQNDELRSVLNSGHRKGGSVLRTVGDDHEPRSFATYSGCVISLIGILPDTLHDRSVVVDLKRKLPSEKAEGFRPDRACHLDVLARKAAR
jgi:putative DNA primase/helicase